MMLHVWLAAALLGGTTLAAPQYAASIRAPQIDLDLDLESPHHDHDFVDPTGSSPLTPLLDKRQRQGTYKFDFKWVKRWAAIGDSYTAGIYAGSKLGSRVKNSEDYKCSRYTHAWPRLMANWLGGNRDFQFKACSGARSNDIYEQARSLNGNLDLVVMTAGGNDLCLLSVIRSCIVTAYHGEQACNDAIEAAEDNLRGTFKTNLRYIFDELLPKMSDDSMVMLMGYAPFFDEENESCANQDWAVPIYWEWDYNTGNGLKLTTARRARLNELVMRTNQALKEVVDEYIVDPRADAINLRFVDWSEWPALVDGEMCNSKSDGNYPDPKQPNLMFFKPNTKSAPIHDPLRRRTSNSTHTVEDNYGASELDGTSPAAAAAAAGNHDHIIDNSYSTKAYYDSPLYKSPNPGAVALEKLDKRAPATPQCPGDNGWFSSLGKMIPDYYGSWFHPNTKGQAAMASIMLKHIAIQHARLRGIAGAEICQIGGTNDVPSCHGVNPNRKNYFVNWRLMDKGVKEFCENLQPPSTPVTHWSRSETYNWDTPEEFEITLQLRNGATHWRGEEFCKETLLRLVHGCDANRPDNPLNYKWGGRWPRGFEVYEIKPKWERKLHTTKDGRCRAKDSVFFHSYKVEGRGWATANSDGGELKRQIKYCAGDACSYFKFGFYKRDEHPAGYEWWATFTCPKGKVEHCWNNQAVPNKFGGHTHKWRQNMANERYDDVGCTRDMSY